MKNIPIEQQWAGMFDSIGKKELAIIIPVVIITSPIWGGYLLIKKIKEKIKK
jgi:hypothetical protein